MLKRFAEKLKFGCAAAAVAVGMMSAAPANAIIFAGTWDPAFGAAFPDLGWSGEAKFFIPDACLSQSGWVSNFDSCSSGEMKIVSAEVDFYKLSDPTNPAFQETLSFDVPSNAVLAVELTNGILSAIFGSFLYSVDSTLPIAGGGYTEFFLLFKGDVALMAFLSDPPDGKPTFGFSDINPPDGTPFITFSVVSEPSMMALYLGALGLLLMARRRRDAA